MDKNTVNVEALGPVNGPEFLKAKRRELEAYNLEVHGWERGSYLETL